MKDFRLTLEVRLPAENLAEAKNLARRMTTADLARLCESGAARLYTWHDGEVVVEAIKK